MLYYLILTLEHLGFPDFEISYILNFYIRDVQPVSSLKIFQNLIKPQIWRTSHLLVKDTQLVHRPSGVLNFAQLSMCMNTPSVNAASSFSPILCFSTTQSFNILHRGCPAMAKLPGLTIHWYPLQHSGPPTANAFRRHPWGSSHAVFWLTSPRHMPRNPDTEGTALAWCATY